MSHLDFVTALLPVKAEQRLSEIIVLNRQVSIILRNETEQVGEGDGLSVLDEVPVKQSFTPLEPPTCDEVAESVHIHGASLSAIRFRKVETLYTWGFNS